MTGVLYMLYKQRLDYGVSMLLTCLHVVLMLTCTLCTQQVQVSLAVTRVLFTKIKQRPGYSVRVSHIIIKSYNCQCNPSARSTCS